MSKRTKSTLPPAIRGIVRFRLEHYHSYKQQLNSFFNDLLPSNTAQLSHERKAHNGENRAVENNAITIAESAYILEIEKSVNAIEYVVSRLTEEDRKLVEMVYWRATHSLTGAGVILNMSQRTAYRHADAILTALAIEMGLVPREK
ncbi:MAG: hypothetical protein KBT02_10270 [Treponema sp.]|nr:hypothetical protein [Candidatus Treponema caballi]